MRSRRAPALCCAWFVTLFACAGDGDEGGESLCTEKRDPRGLICGMDGLFGSTRAFARAREAVSDAGLVSVTSSPTGLLDVDGLGDRWEFVFENSAGARIIAGVEESDVRVRTDAPLPVDERCGEEGFIEPLDSEQVVPDAVRRFEARVGRRFEHSRDVLSLGQEGCFLSFAPETHYVHLLAGSDQELSEPSERYFARYRDDGSFIELVGPCSDNLRTCLIGPAP